MLDIIGNSPDEAISDKSNIATIEQIIDKTCTNLENNRRGKPPPDQQIKQSLKQKLSNLPRSDAAITIMID